MEDAATDIMKSKSNSSMAQGLRMLAEGMGDAFVSAGNSGALCVGATLIVKRIKGIKRCAFAPVIPSAGGLFMLIDSGANVECRPEMLKQFGIMGYIYMKNIMSRDLLFLIFHVTNLVNRLRAQWKKLCLFVPILMV